MSTPLPGQPIELAVPPPSLAPLAPDPPPISGMLWLAGLSLILTPFMCVAYFTDYALMGTWRMFDFRVWAAVLIWGSSGAASLWAAFVFFGRSRQAPQLVIAVAIYNLLSTLLSEWLFFWALSGQGIDFGQSSVPRIAAYAAVWVPYLLNSQRVRETFVRDGSQFAAIKAFFVEESRY